MRQNAGRIPHPVLIAIVVVIATILRIAANSLPVAYDEPVYYNVARQYADAIRSGQWAALPDLDSNIEHPALAKLAYGLVLAPQPPAPEAPVEPSMVADPDVLARLRDMRLLASAFSTLTVLLVALANPLAALLFAAHSTALRFTSLALLEPLAVLTSTISVLAYIRSERRLNGWLIASALGLGLAAASKYMYAVAGIAIALDWLMHAAAPRDGDTRTTHSLAGLLGWGLLAVAVFVAADVTLWPAPLARLGESLAMTVMRTRTEHVASYGYGRLHVIEWLFTPLGFAPPSIVTPIDPLVAALGVVGFGRLWRQQRVMALWWAVGLVFLLAWAARFPHYVTIVAVPLAFSAAAGAALLWEWIAGRASARSGNRTTQQANR